MKKLFARLMMTAVMLFAASMVEAQRMGETVRKPIRIVNN